MDLIERLAQDKDAIHALVIRDTADIVAVRGADGTRLRLRNKTQSGSGGGGVSSGAVIGKITGGSTAAGYTVDLYANGIDQDSTGTATVTVLDLARADNLSVGDYIMCQPAATTITGGTP